MRQPRVVHVDDCEDIRTLVQLALDTVAGIPLVQFESGEDAVKHAGEFDADIFLLDVMMPGLTGPQTYERLRSLPKFSSTPAIFLTAKATQKELAQLNGPGVVGTITKPFDALLLGDQITALWQACLVGKAA